MGKKKVEEMREQEVERDEVFLCPVGRLFHRLERPSGKGARFFEHLTRSRVEFLKAIRSLVDDRIEELEKQGSAERRKATKIQVE